MNNIFIYKNSPAVWRRVFHSFDWRKRTGHLYFPSVIKAALYCGHDPQHPRSSSHSNYATVHWKYETSSWIPRASLILLFQSEKIETHWIYKNERNIPSPSYIIWKQNYLFRARVLHYKNKLLTAFFFLFCWRRISLWSVQYPSSFLLSQFHGERCCHKIPDKLSPPFAWYSEFLPLSFSFVTITSFKSVQKARQAQEPRCDVRPIFVCIQCIFVDISSEKPFPSNWSTLHIANWSRLNKR